MSEVSRPDPAPSPGSGSRRLKYALIVSLALNLLVLGAAAGTLYTYGFGKHGPQRFGPGRGEDFGLMSLTYRLPEERRKEIRKKLREDRAVLKPLIEDVRAARRTAAETLAAAPYDRAALESAITVSADKERTLRQAAVAAFLGHADTLTAEERGLLAERWLKMNEPFKERGSKKKGKTGDEPKPPPPAD